MQSPLYEKYDTKMRIAAINEPHLSIGLLFAAGLLLGILSRLPVGQAALRTERFWLGGSVLFRLYL